MQYQLILSIFLLILSSLSVTAQEQLSNFVHLEAFDTHPHKGIVDLDGEQYLLQQSDSQLIVSVIESDTIRQLYETDDNPNGELYSHRAYSISVNDNRSRFYVEDSILYEFYQTKIYQRNIKTGEIKSIHQIDEYYSKRIISITIEDNYIHFVGDNGLIAYFNTDSDELTVTDYYYAATIIKNNTYYQADHQGIVKYNILTGETTTEYTNNSAFLIAKNKSTTNPGFLIYDGEIKVFSINTNTIIESNVYPFSIILSNVTDFLLIGNHLTIIIPENDLEEGAEIFIIDINTGDITYNTEVGYINVDAGYQIFYDTLFNDEFIIMGHSDYGEIIIYDFESETPHVYDGHRIYRTNNSYYRNDNFMYFLGSTIGIDYSNQHLYKLDLNNYDLEIKSIIGGGNMAIGPDMTDSTLIISGDDKVYLLDRTDMLEQKFEIKHLINLGARYLNMVASDQQHYAFTFQDSLYVGNGADFHTILGYEAISSIFISNFMITGMITLGDASYMFTYDIVDDDLSYSNPLPVEDLSKTIFVGHEMFGSFTVHDGTYYDFGILGIKNLQIEDKIIEIHSSDNVMLLVTECDNGNQCAMTRKDEVNSTIAKTFANLEIKSKEDGTFFLLSRSEDNTRVIEHISQDGEILSSTTFDGVLVNHYTEEMSGGKFSVFLYHDQDELKLIAHRKNAFTKTTTEYQGYNSAPIIWHKGRKSLVFKSESDQYHLYTDGLPLKALNLNGSELVSAIFRNGIIDIITRGGTTLYQYTYHEDTHEQIDVNEISAFHSSTIYHTYDSYRLDESRYLFPMVENWWWTISNDELYILDLENHTFELESDINQRDRASNPNKFALVDGYYYFTARSPSDNSYQLFRYQAGEWTNTKGVSKAQEEFTISPTISAEAIAIDRELTNLEIYSTDGKLMQQITHYKSRSEISIIDLPKGLYFIRSADYATKPFIKI